MIAFNKQMFSGHKEGRKNKKMRGLALITAEKIYFLP